AWHVPKPAKSPECPYCKGFSAGILLGIQRQEVALKSSLRGRDLGTLGTLGGSKIANIFSAAPLSGLDRPFLLAVALVEVVSQFYQRRKLDAALIARLPSAATPVLLP